MVRIPISINVLIPNHLLFPPKPEPPADHDLSQYRNGAPSHLPGSLQGSRFGNYPGGIAAYNVMASFKSQMSPTAVAPVPGFPAAVVAAAAGRRYAASAITDSSTLLADAEAELRALALLAARGAAVGGPLSPAVAGILWPTPTAKKDDRPLELRKRAEKRVVSDRVEARQEAGSAFTPTPPSGRLEDPSVPPLVAPTSVRRR